MPAQTSLGDLSDLFEGLVRLALGGQEDFSPSLELLPLLPEPVDLIVSLSHPWCDNGTIQSTDLSGTSVILCDLDSAVMNVVTKELATIGVQPDKLKTTLLQATPEAFTIAAAQGLGIGFVPRTIHSRFSSRQVATVELEDFSLRLELFLGRIPAGPR